MKRISGSGRGLVRSAWLLSTVAVVVPTAAMAQAPAEAQDTGVEDIVVTAQKREQNLQDVPISITALSTATIEANRVRDARDLSSLSPNLTVRSVGGGSQIPSYSMRGLVTFGTAAGTDKGVSVYLDGVYVQNVVGSVFELADIERIEILKGPQGTLFGRNATGGAISYITRNPSGEFGVKQEFTYGNLDQLRSKTRIDLPQFGPLSISATYLHSERRGDIRNLGAGTQWNYGPATGGRYGIRTSPKYLGGDNVEAVAAAVKLDLHPDVDIVYKFDYTENNYTPNGVGLSYIPSPQYLSLYNAIPANMRTPITTRRPDAVNNWFTTPSFTRSYGHNLTAKWQVNDQISFKNILAYRNSRLTATFQLDGLGGARNFSGIPNPFSPLLPPINFSQLVALGQLSSGRPTANPGLNLALPFPAFLSPSVANDPFSFLTNNAQTFEKQWSNEFQMNIRTDWFNLTAGYLHFDDKIETGGLDGTFNTFINTVFSGQNTSSPGSFVIPGNPGYFKSTAHVISDAWFVQPEIHLTDQIDLIAGARITKDKKSGAEHLPDFRVAGFNTLVPISYRDSKATYLVGANYRPTDDILTYAKYSTGYISGGQLATLQFKPETAKSWEAGIKADLFDRKFRSNLSIFSVKYRNIQQATSGTLTGVPATAAFAQAVVNSANGKAKGFEWENTIVPFYGVTLTGNLGYTDFKFDQDTLFAPFSATAPGNIGGFKGLAGAPGYQEFNRPKWTGSVSAQYETGEVLAGGHLVFRVDGNYHSKIITLPNISTNATGNTLNVNAPLDPLLLKAATVKASWLVNARVALADIQMLGAKGQIALFGRNVFDNKQVYYSGGLGPVQPVGYERARTYGVDVGFEF